MAYNRHAVLAPTAWWTWVDSKPAVELPTQAQALDLLVTEGRDFWHAGKSGRPDHAREMLFITWAESVLRGRSYGRSGHYDHLVFSPVHWIRWAGQAVPVLEPETPAKVKTYLAHWRSRDDLAKDWWPSRYEAALADPAVLKLRRGKVQLPDGSQVPLEAHLLDLYGPP